MTKVTVTPWEVNCKCSLVPSEKHTFVFEISRFSNFLKIFQLFSHVCIKNAIQTANVHWSPAGSILFFTSQGGWTTFVTRLHEYGHPDCKCSLVPSGKHTFFHLTRGVNNFCHTSAWIWPSRLQMFTGPLREAYFFSRKFTPECWRRFGIMFSLLSSFSTLKSIRRVSKIVHLPKSMNFRTVISNTWSVSTLKSIRRSAKIGHLKPENAPNALPMQVWSIRTLLKS